MLVRCSAFFRIARPAANLTPCSTVVAVVAALLGIVVACALPTRAADPAGGGGMVVLFTADTEGHLSACSTCPMHQGLGGLDRRATALARAGSEATGPILLVDAGNWLAGAESVASRGEVMLAAYEALGYDVVHLTTKDLYWGKADTLALLAKFPKLSAVSANLLDAETGKPLVSPYVVKTIGATRVAVIGVSEPPAGLASLPHLRQQLAGVTIRPSAEAVDEWLPKAKAEADRVLVLYHGRGAALRALRTKLAGSGAWVVAAGVRPEANPADGDPPVLAAEEHGKSIGRAELAGAGAAPALTQLMVTPDLPPDGAMRDLIAARRAAVREPAAAAAAAQPTTATATAPSESDATAGGRSGGPRALVGLKLPGAAGATSARSVPPPPPPSSPASTTVEVTPPAAQASSQPATQPRVTAKQSRQPQGLPGVGLTQEQVNASIDRGADFLWGYLKEKSLASGKGFGFYSHTGYDLLACQALVHAGFHRRNAGFRAELESFFGRLDPAGPLVGTYENGVLAMLIESHADPVYLGKLRHSVRRLLEQQGAGGSWGYDGDVPPEAFADGAQAGRVLRSLGGEDPDAPPAAGVELKRLSPWERGKDGDNSTTQFATLGLWAGARCGFKAPADAWRRCIDVTRKRQCIDGSWHYDAWAYSGYGSMTCAGIVTLAIARHELGEPDPAADESIERGLAWLAEHFVVSENPKSGANNMYYLYSLERVGRVLDTELIGPHEWYPLGAKFLVDSQRGDGAWVEMHNAGDPLPSTAFALLFLTRATPTLAVKPRPRGGRGELRTVAAMPAAPTVYVVLDCSGSMLSEMDGRPKFDIAREAIAALFDQLPPGTQAALRVYGHRNRAGEVLAETDSELVIPAGPVDRARVGNFLTSLRARGKTPLTHSLKETRKDLASLPPARTVVVLLTDGGDDTRARGGAVEAAAALGAMNDVDLHIVGFDIRGDEPTVQLRAMADRAEGTYLPATRADELADQLFASALGRPSRFDVLDLDGREVAAGKFGQSMALPEAKYRLAVRYAGRSFEEEFWINTDRTTTVLFDITAARAAAATQPVAATAPAGGPAAAEPPEQPAPAGVRFCAQCGARLTGAGKFCTACGARLTR